MLDGHILSGFPVGAEGGLCEISFLSGFVDVVDTTGPVGLAILSDQSALILFSLRSTFLSSSSSSSSSSFFSF